MPSLKGSSNVDGLVTKNDSANDWLKIFKYIDCICVFFNSKIQVTAKEIWWCTIGIQPGHLSSDFRTRLEQFARACLPICLFPFSSHYLFIFVYSFVRRKTPYLGKHSRSITCGAWNSSGMVFALGSEDCTITCKHLSTVFVLVFEE